MCWLTSIQQQVLSETCLQFLWLKNCNSGRVGICVFAFFFFMLLYNLWDDCNPWWVCVVRNFISKAGFESYIGSGAATFIELDC